MKITNLRPGYGEWRYFNLNVGGFTIKNCRWHPPTKRILFPVRYDRSRYPRRYRVVFAYGAQVKRLRGLLESGKFELRRNRKPCNFKIRGFGHSTERYKRGEPRRDWLIFDFTVRGFKILGCRWNRETRSIQLPVTYLPKPGGRGHTKQRVVCAFGSHINRLRNALEAVLAKSDRTHHADKNHPAHQASAQGVYGPLEMADSQSAVAPVSEDVPVEVGLFRPQEGSVRANAGTE